MREKGPVKGYIVLVNDTTGESTFFEAEPLHLDDTTYQILMNGRGQVIGNVTKDGNFDINYFSMESGIVNGTVSLGTGDGSTKDFSGSANGPVYTVQIKDGDNVVAKDDGNGNIVGTGVTGTVDYNTGDISVSFETAPANGDEIVADVTKNCC